MPQNSRNQGFSYCICFMIEGSWSGSIPLTKVSGYGSGRPQNTWIRWIRIRNTALKHSLSTFSFSFFSLFFPQFLQQNPPHSHARLIRAPILTPPPRTPCLASAWVWSCFTPWGLGFRLFLAWIPCYARLPFVNRMDSAFTSSSL
jgi:hypothetical protein